MYASTEQRNRERVQVLADQLYRKRYHYSCGSPATTVPVTTPTTR